MCPRACGIGLEDCVCVCMGSALSSLDTCRSREETYSHNLLGEIVMSTRNALDLQKSCCNCRGQLLWQSSCFRCINQLDVCYYYFLLFNEILLNFPISVT